jgi:hypothetical protein
MSTYGELRRGRPVEIIAMGRSEEPDSMERVHREFDQRNLRHAMELILASPDAEEIVTELNLRLTQRGQIIA